MTFASRRRTARALAALVAIVALAAPLALAGAALAQTSSITQQDCDQGTIHDKSGQPISKARCEQLLGKQVQLASTGFEVWPLIAGAGVLVIGAAALGFRRNTPVL
jgi:hypothetical protein